MVGRQVDAERPSSPIAPGISAPTFSSPHQLLTKLQFRLNLPVTSLILSLCQSSLIFFCLQHPPSVTSGVHLRFFVFFCFRVHLRQQYDQHDRSSSIYQYVLRRLISTRPQPSPLLVPVAPDTPEDMSRDNIIGGGPNRSTRRLLRTTCDPYSLLTAGLEV